MAVVLNIIYLLQAEWARAWHGCKMQALYSIMFHGRLAASCDLERGDRFFAECPGVYCHKDATRFKAEFYASFAELCRDSVYWCCLWELNVDRADRVYTEFPRPYGLDHVVSEH